MKKEMRSIYDAVRSGLPAPLRTLGSKIAFRLRRRPIYRAGRRPGQPVRPKRGFIVVSADFELGWAWRYSRDDGKRLKELCRSERNNIPVILDMLDRLNFPVTWAVVGHLFLEKCEKKDGKLAHQDMPRPQFFKNHLWVFQNGDWYDHDPGMSEGKDDFWYAPDLIKKIIGSSVKHEIACHSFSHIGFSERYCHQDLARAELQKCSQVMSSWGIKPVTMVFPGDDAGNFAALVQAGYRCVRYFPEASVEIAMPVRMPEGLWAFPVASCIVPDEHWDPGYILWRLKKYVDKAAEKSALCHFWFHPSLNTSQMRQILFPILEYCARRRSCGDLDILTMERMAELMEEECAA